MHGSGRQLNHWISLHCAFLFQSVLMFSNNKTNGNSTAYSAVTIAEAERTFSESSRRLSPRCRPPTLPQAPPRMEYNWRSDRFAQVENKENNNITTFLLLHELSRNCELSIKYDRVFLHTFRTLVVASKSVDTTWKDFDQL